MMSVADSLNVLLPVAIIAVIWAVAMLVLQRRKADQVAGKPVKPLKIVLTPRLVYFAAAALFGLYLLSFSIQSFTGQPKDPDEIVLVAVGFFIVATLISVPLWIVGRKKAKDSRKEDHF